MKTKHYVDDRNRRRTGKTNLSMMVALYEVLFNGKKIKIVRK